jgi:ADP-heptose:LPS heptosyltransferase
MKQAPPYLGKYWIRRPLLGRLVQALDAALGVFTTRRRFAQIPTPARILLANGGHLGDVLFATAVVPVLKRAIPGVRIGFLVGEWARPVVADQPLIDAVHVVDHWKLNRGNASLTDKVRRYWQTRRQALQSIRVGRYEVAIDLSYYFPNNVALLWSAGIPARIGYTSGGFGPLLTHPLTWKNRPAHVIDYHADLLRVLLGSRCVDALQSWLQPLPPMPSQLDGCNLPHRYVVLHLGTGAAFKEWPIEYWRALAERLIAAGHYLVFTGKGERERQQVAHVVKNLPCCLDLCDRIDWRGLAAVLRGASLLVGAESVAALLASALRVPCVMIHTGVGNPHHWRPWRTPHRVLIHDVPCSPCYLSQGCAEMSCVRATNVAQVFAAVQSLLDGPSVAAAS